MHRKGSFLWEPFFQTFQILVSKEIYEKKKKEKGANKKEKGMNRAFHLPTLGRRVETRGCFFISRVET